MGFAIGEMVGPYRIVEQLGQGGMATVYKAYHAALDRFVAIKVLHAAFREDPGFLARFQREARIVAKLEHPHILPVYDFNEHNGYPYLVMKFVEGKTLKKRLREGPMSPDETLEVLEAVGDALEYAHEQGVLHRDIKPSNIMIGDDGTYYLTDFGLARMVQSGESTISQDMMLGTPQYISPEQAMGIQELDARTDIYSLGVVLYEMVVGRVPFSADTPYAIIHDHIYKPLPLPRNINPSVSPAVERVLLKALDKDRDSRYRTVTELVEAFRQALRQEKEKQSEGSTVADLEGATIFDTVRSQSAADAIKAAIRQETPPPTPTPAIKSSAVKPTVIAQPAIPTEERVIPIEPTRKRRGWGWAILGMGTLLVVCLVSAVMIIDTIGDVYGPGHMAIATLAPLDDWSIRDDELWQSLRNVYVPSDPEELETLIEDAVDRADRENSVDAHFELAMLLMEHGDTGEAKRELSRAISACNGDVPQLVALASALESREYEGEALLVWLEALSVEPDNETLEAMTGRRLYSAATNLAPSEEYSWLFSMINEKYSSLPLVRVMEVLTAIGQGKIDGSLDELDVVLGEQADMAEAILVKGISIAESGDPETAAEIWEQLATDPAVPYWVQEEARRLIWLYTETQSHEST